VIDEQLRQLLQTAVDAALAGQQAESVIRAHLLAADSTGPLDILDEEQRFAGNGTHFRWTVDPINGTRPFVDGIPFRGSLGRERRVYGWSLAACCLLTILFVSLTLGHMALSAGRERHSGR
jgi:hypothetical protein